MKDGATSASIGGVDVGGRVGVGSRHSMNNNNNRTKEEERGLRNFCLICGFFVFCLPI